MAVGAIMMVAALIGPGVGAAAADDLKPDPATPSAGPVAQKGIRSQAVQGDLREADKGVVLAQGDVRGSNEAVPTTKGESPQPGNLSNLGYDCLFVWSQFCQ